MKFSFDKAYLKKLYYGEPQNKIKLPDSVIRQYVKVVNRLIRARDFGCQGHKELAYREAWRTESGHPFGQDQ